MILTRAIAKTFHLLIEIFSWLVLIAGFIIGFTIGDGFVQSILFAIGGLIAAFVLLVVFLGLFVQIQQIRHELEQIRSLLAKK